jgi:cytochrome c oxidase assembly protein subunit 11
MRARSRITALVLSGVAVGMVGLAYAAEPLYKAFCAVTGFGGTTQVATERPKEILDRVVRVYFDANIEQGVPLDFTPSQPYVDVRIGETMMTYFELTNTSDEPVRAMAARTWCRTRRVSTSRSWSASASKSKPTSRANR